MDKSFFKWSNETAPFVMKTNKLSHLYVIANLFKIISLIQYTSLPVNLLPSEFTLSELQTTFEILLEKPVEKKSFRRRILSSDILEETGAMKSGPSRPAKLYQVVNKEGKNYLFPRTLEGSR